MEVELLNVERTQGGLYVRYVGWRDETRKRRGLGSHVFDGIRCDLLNDHKMQHEDVDAAIARFAARTHRLNRWGDRSGTTLNLQVSASAYDGTELIDTGGTNNNAPTVRCYSNTGATTLYDAIAVFQSVTVPFGAIIDAADCTIVPDVTNDDVDCWIHCEDTDSASSVTPGAGAADLSSRSLTTAATAWSTTSLGTSPVTTPDIAAAVQEVINRTGWASGNALAVYWKHRTDSTTRSLEFTSYDGSAANAPKLDIDYTYRQRTLTLLGVG